MVENTVVINFREEVEKIVESANNMFYKPQDLLFDIMAGEVMHETKLSKDDLVRLYHQMHHYVDVDCNNYVGNYYKIKNLSDKMFKVIVTVIIEAKSGEATIVRCRKYEGEPTSMSFGFESKITKQLEEEEGLSDIKLSIFDVDMDSKKIALSENPSIDDFLFRKLKREADKKSEEINAEYERIRRECDKLDFNKLL